MFFRNRWLQLSALSALLAGIGIIALRPKYSVLDYDIWWHLKVGDWIVDNLSLPHSGILSRTAAARPWSPTVGDTKYCSPGPTPGSAS